MPLFLNRRCGRTPSYDTTGDGRLDAFDTNQDGALDVSAPRVVAAKAKVLVEEADAALAGQAAGAAAPAGEAIYTSHCIVISLVVHHSKHTGARDPFAILHSTST
jgi:hypothetical protein